MNSPFQKLRDQSGTTIVEVMASAVLMVVIATSVFAALEATGRAGAQERHRARAYAIAQDDQARLRSMQVSQVTRINETRTVTQDGISYTVVSTGTPKLDRTTTASCDSGNNPSDYIAISSTVTWTSMGTRPPVVVESLIAPPNGSLDSTRGALGVSVVNSRSVGYSGITVSGSGAQSFSGTTDATGCVIFGDLPAGNYTVTPTILNLVDKDGNPPAGKATSVVPGSSNTSSFQFDKGGTLKATFTTKNPAGTVVPSSADTMMVFNSGMTQAERFGTLGTDSQIQTATPLFPFVSLDTMYAGGCPANADPTTNSVAIGSAQVPINGGTAATQTIQLPALRMVVRSGTSSSSAGSLVNAARVTVTDQTCSINGTPYKKIMATGSAGTLAGTSATSADNPGLPYSTNYTVCISGTASSGGVKQIVRTNVALTDPANPRDLGTIYLNGPGNVVGACP